MAFYNKISLLEEGIHPNSAFLEASKILKKLEVKVNKSPGIVQQYFSLKNLTRTIINYKIYVTNCEKLHKVLNLNSCTSSNDAYSFLSNPCFLLFALSKLKNINIGSSTNGVSITKITLLQIVNISFDIKNRRFKCTPVIRKHIAKSGGGNQTLGISSGLDKIIQQAITLILTPYFEKKMSRFSHGFVKNTSVHTCLNHVKMEWKRVTWLIKFDFEKNFDKSINKKILNNLKKYVKQCSLIEIIKLFLLARYATGYGLTCGDFSRNKSTPQGNIISPILFNILIKNTDKFIETYCKKIITYRFELSKSSPNIYSKPAYWLPISAETKKNMVGINTIQLLRKIVEKDQLIDIARRCILKFNLIDETRKLYFVRYADDIFLGYIGSKNEVYNIVRLFTQHIKSSTGINVNTYKTEIQHHSKGIVYLGYNISSF